MARYRRIACLSTSRADAGIYRPLLRALARDEQFEPWVLASHNPHSFSDLHRVQTITVGCVEAGDGASAVAAATGSAVGAFAEALTKSQPDLVFVLGDRTEMLAAALAATICTLPIAHLHGGDATLGAYDDVCRHSITKLAHCHFPATTGHARVIHALGEAPDRIHTVGALAIDELTQFRPEPVTECSAAVGLNLALPTILVAFHPETVSDLPVSGQIKRLIEALHAWDGQILWFEPNADVGHAEIRSAVSAFAKLRRDLARVTSISQARFWSCLTHCRAMVGNSSAGLIEAASLRRPVVNVGCRQEGRIRPANVIDAEFDAAKIAAAIERATSDAFTASLRNMVNPYGDGNAAPRILAALAGLPDRMGLLRKPPPATSR